MDGPLQKSALRGHTLIRLARFCLLLTNYRVFKLDMTYFEVPDGQLKLTSKFKKR